MSVSNISIQYHIHSPHSYQLPSDICWFGFTLAFLHVDILPTQVAQICPLIYFASQSDQEARKAKQELTETRKRKRKPHYEIEMVIAFISKLSCSH